MQTKHSQIIKSTSNKNLKIFTAPTHEAYQSNWAGMPHTFFLYQDESFIKWKLHQRPLPTNHILLDGSDNQIKADMSFDLVLSQNKFGQYQKLRPIADRLNIPLISLEHTLPVPYWGPKRRNILKNMTGDVNVFISDYSINQWGFNDIPNTEVVHHGIDTNVFHPDNNINRSIDVFSCVNDFINRDIFCGWNIYKEIRSKVPKNIMIHLVGATEGVSEPTKNLEELVGFYKSSKIFLNTSKISPVPTSLMEAMACGCVPVTTDTCMIPEIVKDGENGFLYPVDNPDLGVKKINELLSDNDMLLEMSKKARETIEVKYNLDKHIKSWESIFNKVKGQSRNVY